MRHSKWLSLPFVAARWTVGLVAQQPKTFKARLSPVPIDIAMQANVAGSGSITGGPRPATKLTLTGTFEGLRGPATTAQVHKVADRGMRGPVVADLTVAKGAEPTAGTISRHARSHRAAGHRPRKRAVLRAASQREGAGRQLVGMAPLPQENRTMRRPLACAGGARRSPLALGIALVSGQPPAAVLHR